MQIILPVQSLGVLSVSELRSLAYAAAEYRDAEAIHLAAGADKTLRLANRLSKKTQVVILCPKPCDETPSPQGLLDALAKAVRQEFGRKGVWRPSNWDTIWDCLWLSLGYIYEQLPEGGDDVQVRPVRRNERVPDALRRQDGGGRRADRAQAAGQQDPR